MSGVKEMERDCDHRIRIPGLPGFSAWVKYPPIVGKMRTCVRCGALKAGQGTVTIAANHIEMSTAVAPGNPAAGLVRLYAPTSTTFDERDNAGIVTNLAGGAAGLTLEGSNTTEATTTSTTAVDILSVASLNIPAATPMLILAQVRKATGAAATAEAGLKLNTTQVVNDVAWSGGSNAAQNASWLATVLNRADALYTLPLLGRRRNTLFENDAVPPTVAITDVIITGLVNDALITMGVDELFVYSLSV